MTDEPYNDLTTAELERLALLSEECGEVVQIIGKILRHSYYSYHPADETCRRNRQLLEKELGDLWFAVGLMASRGDINLKHIDKYAKKKTESVKPYLHHQES